VRGVFRSWGSGRLLRAVSLTLCLSSASLVQAALADEAVTLRVMSFNVWYGGEQVSLAKVGEAIRAADADIVGIQEADGNLDAIAEAAGMPYIDPRRRLLSRWPIFDSGAGERSEHGASPYSVTGLDRDAIHAWVMVRPGKVVAVANVHLSNEPSGTGLARDGRPLAEVLAAEQASRVVEATPLAALGRLAAEGTPVFLTGDFNTPSHHDWTEAVRRVRPEIPYAVAWPVTRLLEGAGLRDSYREAHPDPGQRSRIHLDAGYAAPHPAAGRGPRPHRLRSGWRPHRDNFLDHPRRAGRAGCRHRGLTLAFRSSRGGVDVQGHPDRCAAADRRHAAQSGRGRTLPGAHV
jgi:endonuclease/exonuclease/phosphatase family metal-dependent hydrolase